MVLKLAIPVGTLLIPLSMQTCRLFTSLMLGSGVMLWTSSLVVFTVLKVSYAADNHWKYTIVVSLLLTVNYLQQNLERVDLARSPNYYFFRERML